MNSTVNSNLSHWIPEQNEFQHICPVCNKTFMGRKNRNYCSLFCKTRINNDKAGIIRKKKSAITAKFLLNAMILAEFYPFSLGKNKILIKLLERNGFDPCSEFSSVKSKENGEIWKKAGDYGYLVLPDKEHVLIEKISVINK